MVSPLQEKASCCVIGASFHGLAAADALKAVGYADLTILEQNNAVGGPWSLGGYASLQTNTPAESFHYPSFPPGPAFVNQHGRVNGSEVQAYLNHYVDERNLRQHIQFNTFVEDVQETTDGRWKVATSRGEHIFDKLVVASGIFSKPALPDWAIPLRVRLPGQQSSPNSTGWAVHTSALEHASLRTAILKDCQPESHIVVVGSSKSALDTATWLARDTSSKVTLLSRTAPVPNPGPLSGRLGLQWGMMSRLAASFAPYYPAFGYVPSLWRRFIHHTVLGRFLRRWFWNDMLSSCLSFNQYHRSHNAQKLAPVKKQNYAWMHSTKIFPVTPDFYEHVHSGRINVIRGSVVGSEADDQGQVRLSVLPLDNTGDVGIVKCDGVFMATGYKAPCFPFFATTQRCALGLTAPEQFKKWHKLDHWARSILEGPNNNTQLPKRSGSKQSFDRLYRRLVPTSHLTKRNIAFAGAIATFCAPIPAEIQALWIAAFFKHNTLRLPHSQEHAEQDVALMCQWEYLRYGSSCLDGACLAFDTLAYLDTLVADLGQSPNRKSWRILELISPYQASDYKELRAKFIETYTSL